MSKKKIRCTVCHEKFKSFQVVVSYKNRPYCLHCFRNKVVVESEFAHENDYVLEVEVNGFFWHKKEELPKLFSVDDGKKNYIFDDEIPY